MPSAKPLTVRPSPLVSRSIFPPHYCNHHRRCPPVSAVAKYRLSNRHILSNPRSAPPSDIPQWIESSLELRTPLGRVPQWWV